MTTNGGKNFLRTCLANIDISLNIDKIFCYKYATRKHAVDYQTDEYVAILTDAQINTIKSGVPYVITCFTHLEIFVVWHQSIGSGNGKYPVSKHDLVAFENNSTCDYLERIIGKTEDAKVYIFRNESGFNKFYQNVVAPSITV